MSGGVDSSVAAAGCCDARPRGGRRHDASCGAATATPGAARSPTSTTPAASPSSSASTTSCSTSATTSTAHVVEPYVDAHAPGVTPNPCIECNRHLKFARLGERADLLGFDAVATGHHARIVERPDGTPLRGRGADAAKDQSYVLHMLGQDAARPDPVPGRSTCTKAEVRAPRRRARSAHRGQARQPGRVLHHPAPVAAGRSSATASRSARPRWSTPTAPRSVRSTRSSWSRIGQRKGLGLRRRWRPALRGRRRRRRGTRDRRRRARPATTGTTRVAAMTWARPVAPATCWCSAARTATHDVRSPRRCRVGRGGARLGRTAAAGRPRSERGAVRPRDERVLGGGIAR